MAKIIPHLWFDREAREAAEYYASIIPESKIISTTVLHDTPSGNAEVVIFELAGQQFQAISAGPLFKLNPSVSFHVKCETKEEVDAIWEKLSMEGSVLMELGEYPSSERFGWVQDKFGLSWQVSSTGGAKVDQKLTPVVMFVGEVCGRAEEAVNLWTSIFHPSQIKTIIHYGKGEAPDREGTLKYAAFSLFGQEFGAMDSAYEHLFRFNEAISFIVLCDTQDEIDEYWEQLSAMPEAEQCGWLKDRFGFSWQIVPAGMGALLAGDDRARVDRVTRAFLMMKKLDIAVLQAAYDNQ